MARKAVHAAAAELAVLEAYCSATGVARTAREFLEKSDEPSLLREIKPEDITSYEVSIAAGKGDALAKRVYDFTGKMLGEACADFAAFASPEAFVFFGGLTKAGDLLMKPLKESYDNTVLPIFKGKAKFLVSTLDGSSASCSRRKRCGLGFIIWHHLYKNPGLYFCLSFQEYTVCLRSDFGGILIFTTDMYFTTNAALF